jgi:hypothetical protein
MRGYYQPWHDNATHIDALQPPEHNIPLVLNTIRAATPRHYIPHQPSDDRVD